MKPLFKVRHDNYFFSAETLHDSFSKATQAHKQEMESCYKQYGYRPIGYVSLVFGNNKEVRVAWLYKSEVHISILGSCVDYMRFAYKECGDITAKELHDLFPEYIQNKL